MEMNILFKKESYEGEWKVPCLGRAFEGWEILKTSEAVRSWEDRHLQ